MNAGGVSIPKLTYSTKSFAPLWIVALCCLVAVSCARLRPSPWRQASPEAALTLLQTDWLADTGRRMARFQGRLLFGSRKVNLDVLVLRDGAKLTARAVTMGDMGITLCDMDVTPSGHIMHGGMPLLRKHPLVQKHIARTLRRVLLLPLPQAPYAVFDREAQNEIMLRYVAQGLTLERVYDAASGSLVRLQEAGGAWTVDFSEYQEHVGQDLPYPRRIEYRDVDGGYRVQTLLLSFEPVAR